MDMKYTNAGLCLTKSFEQCRLTPYQDEAGIWTDGWGNTHGVVQGKSITQKQADDQLLANVQDAVASVNKLVKIDLSQNQFNACVDFVFNCGGRAFQTSTLLRKLNSGDIGGALAEFSKWNKAGGNVSRGLDRRRKGETDLFSRPDKA